MKRRWNRAVAGLVCVCLVSSLARIGWAEEKPAAKNADGKFLRFVDDGDGGGRLEAAIATYEKGGVKVHLVSAVHVGEKKYYDDLTKTFKGYDSLLYEMVKPKDAAVPGAGVKSESMVSAFQRMLKDFLELDFQLDAIDYTAKKMIEVVTKLRELWNGGVSPEMIAHTLGRPEAEVRAKAAELKLPQHVDAIP